MSQRPSFFAYRSRDLYATILLHNAFATFGVLGAATARGELELYAKSRPELLMTAAAAIVLLIAADRVLLRR